MRRSPADVPVKRLLDVVLAGCALVLLSPLLLVIAGAIRLTMGAPILFRQTRPGLRGRPFVLLKFRTMIDVDDSGGEYDHQRDLAEKQARITTVGGWLRKSSLDELPELWNVVRGDMSIVGPRPLLMEYLSHYTPQQMRRHEARPGITGLAQVRGRHALGWNERFRLDRWYVEHWSFRLDAHILAETVGVLLHGQGSFDAGSEPPRFDAVAKGQAGRRSDDRGTPG